PVTFGSSTSAKTGYSALSETSVCSSNSNTGSNSAGSPVVSVLSAVVGSALGVAGAAGVSVLPQPETPIASANAAAIVANEIREGEPLSVARIRYRDAA